MKFRIARLAQTYGMVCDNHRLNPRITPRLFWLMPVVATIFGARFCAGQSPNQHIVDTNATSWWIYTGDHPIAGNWGIFTEIQARRANLLAIWQELVIRKPPRIGSVRMSRSRPDTFGHIRAVTETFQRLNHTWSTGPTNNWFCNRNSNASTSTIAFASSSGGFRTSPVAICTFGDTRIASGINSKARCLFRRRVSTANDGFCLAPARFFCILVRTMGRTRSIRPERSAASDIDSRKRTKLNSRISTSTARTGTGVYTNPITACECSLVRRPSSSGRADPIREREIRGSTAPVGRSQRVECAEKRVQRRYFLS